MSKCHALFILAAIICGLFTAHPPSHAAESTNTKPVVANTNTPWENSLGMKFVPVPGTKVLFCIWETRVQDYAAYAKASGVVPIKPGFEQGPTHPAVNVSWDDAKAFCKWLTAKEQAAGLLGKNQSYRLPTDAEWSKAVGLPEGSSSTPAEKSRKIKDVYPWGKQWPPPSGAGNYDPSLNVDTYEETAPVGSFKPNQLGIYDLGGNVWEWCEDWYDNDKKCRVLRGASWYLDLQGCLLSAHRFSHYPDVRGSFDGVGFRVVLVGGLAP